MFSDTHYNRKENADTIPVTESQFASSRLVVGYKVLVVSVCVKVAYAERSFVHEVK